QRAVAAQRAEGGDAVAAEGHGVSVRAGDRAPLLVNGEVIDGEPARYRDPQRLGLDHRPVPGPLDRIPQVPGPVGRVRVPGRPVLLVLADAPVVAGAAVGGRGLGVITGDLGG